MHSLLFYIFYQNPLPVREVESGQMAKAFLVFIHTSRIDIDDAILFWNRDHFRWFWGVAMDDRAPTDSLRISHKIPDP